eukprot:scaffold9903_cov106-Isochrysis_galbana.AAC.3
MAKGCHEVTGEAVLARGRVQLREVGAPAAALAAVILCVGALPVDQPVVAQRRLVGRQAGRLAGWLVAGFEGGLAVGLAGEVGRRHGGRPGFALRCGPLLRLLRLLDVRAGGRGSPCR